MLLLWSILSVAAGSQELSELYKQYKASNGMIKASQFRVRDIIIAASDDKLSRSKDLFVSPHVGQTPVDYHPQLKALPKDGEPMVYYSWHIHSYFFHEDENVTQRALAIRDQFISKFNVPTCRGDCFMGGPFDTCFQGSSFFKLYRYLFSPFIKECVCGILIILLMVLIHTVY